VQPFGSKPQKQHVQTRDPVQAMLPALAPDGLGRFWPNWTQAADTILDHTDSSAGLAVIG
jgi:hypothetical protein